MKPEIIQKREDLDLELFRYAVLNKLSDKDYTKPLAMIRTALLDIDTRIIILQENPYIYLDKNRMTINTEQDRHADKSDWLIEHLTEKEFFKKLLAGK